MASPPWKRSCAWRRPPCGRNRHEALPDGRAVVRGFLRGAGDRGVRGVLPHDRARAARRREPGPDQPGGYRFRATTRRRLEYGTLGRGADRAAVGCPGHLEGQAARHHAETRCVTTASPKFGPLQGLWLLAGYLVAQLSGYLLLSIYAWGVMPAVRALMHHRPIHAALNVQQEAWATLIGFTASATWSIWYVRRRARPLLGRGDAAGIAWRASPLQ